MRVVIQIQTLHPIPIPTLTLALTRRPARARDLQSAERRLGATRHHARDHLPQGDVREVRRCRNRQRHDVEGARQVHQTEYETDLGVLFVERGTRLLTWRGTCSGFNAVHVSGICLVISVLTELRSLGYRAKYFAVD
jgi:hypothetical protein